MNNRYVAIAFKDSKNIVEELSISNESGGA